MQAKNNSSCNPKSTPAKATQSREKEREIRRRQQSNFNRRYKAKAQEPLLPGETVWIPDCNTTGTVTKQAATQLYAVQT